MSKRRLCALMHNIQSLNPSASVSLCVIPFSRLVVKKFGSVTRAFVPRRSKVNPRWSSGAAGEGGREVTRRAAAHLEADL